MPTISVLCPVYNTKPYLPRLLDSLMAQTFRDFELIAIDDGSTDGSGALLHDYAAHFPQMRILSRQKLGNPSALNTGLRNATGRYLAFVDSDDWVAPNFLEHLLTTAERTGADLVQCGYAYAYPDRKILRQSAWACRRTGNGIPLKDCPQLFFLDNTLCNKLLLRSMVERFEIQFDAELKMAADLPFFFAALLAAERIVVTDPVLYFYRQERSGQTTSATNRNCFSVFRAFEDVHQFIAAYGFDFIAPWLLHSSLSLFAYMYEKLVPELQMEFFQEMNHYFRSHGIDEHTPIPPGPWIGASLPDKIRWSMLRILHPAALKAILRNDKAAYDRAIAFRLFLLSSFRKAASLLTFR